jgi:lambda family phage portal protein
MSLLSKLKGLFVEQPPVRQDNPMAAPPVTEQTIQVFRVEVPQVEARYEGSYNYWGERSLIPATLQDAVKDATPGVRCELARRSRYWERNSAVMQRLSDLFEQFTVGPNGLRLIPNAGADEPVKPVKPPVKLDPNTPHSSIKRRAVAALQAQPNPDTWNEKVSKWWADWRLHPEIDSLRTFGETQSLIARTWFVDGEVFLLKTADRQGRPKLQLIEGHRVGTPSGLGDVEGSAIIDGVEVNAAGMPVAYHVRKSDAGALNAIGSTLYPYISPAPEDYERIPAANMIHVFEAVRPGMTRGLPFAYAVMNDLHDFEDLQLEEMKAVKSAADLANVYHTKTGEVTDASGFRRVQRNISTQDASGNPTTKTSSITYDMTQTGRDRYLKVGEDVKQFASERPSAATQWFYDYLLSKICAGVGISKLLVMPYSNQGTVVRSDLDVNARFFLARSAVLQRVAREVYLWAVGWGKDWDRTLMGAPGDWSAVIVRPPRSVNVDIGRSSVAMLAELAANVRTRADIWAEQGEDWKEQTEQGFREAAFMDKMSIKYGVPKSDVIALPKAPAPPQTAPAGEPAPAPAPASSIQIHHVNGHGNGNGNGHNRLNFHEEAHQA